MKGNNDLNAINFIVGSNIDGDNPDVNVVEYQANSPVQLVRMVGKKNNVRKTLIENHEYRLTIYEPPIIKGETKDFYYDGSIESYISDILATEDVHGIAYFHQYGQDFSNHNEFQKGLKLALNSECTTRMVGIKMTPNIPDDLLYLRNERISQFLTLDSYPVDKSLLRVPGSHLERLPAEDLIYMWQKNVRSVRGLLERISNMSLIDKSIVERKIKAEIDIKNFFDANEKTLISLNSAINKFTETRDHIDNDVIKWSGDSDLFRDTGVSLSSIGSDGKMELVKSWGEIFPHYETIQKKSHSEIEQKLSDLNQNKSKIINQIKDSCDILKGDSFGGRSCMDFSLLKDAFDAWGQWRG